jgi:hypothetical protein
MDKAKVHSDYHILPGLDFDLLIGYLKKLFQEKTHPMGALMRRSGKLLSPCLKRSNGETSSQP